MAANAPPTEARELALVDKVEMKIALTKDEKLESVLKVYLPPLLLKLGSDHVAVRNKVCRAPQVLVTNLILIIISRLFKHANTSRSGLVAISKFMGCVCWAFVHPLMHVSGLWYSQSQHF